MAFFQSFDGWKNQGRRGKSLFLAHFTKANGESARYNLKAMGNMIANPPPTFTENDKIILDGAMELKPR